MLRRMPRRGARPSHARAPRLLEHLQLGRFSGVYALAVIFVIFAIWVPDTFLTSVTWKTILISQAFTGILALAVLTPLATGMFDLSVAQTMGFCSVVCGILLTRGQTSGSSLRSSSPWSSAPASEFSTGSFAAFSAWTA